MSEWNLLPPVAGQECQGAKGCPECNELDRLLAEAEHRSECIYQTYRSLVERVERERDAAEETAGEARVALIGEMSARKGAERRLEEALAALREHAWQHRGNHDYCCRYCGAEQNYEEHKPDCILSSPDAAALLAKREREQRVIEAADCLYDAMFYAVFYTRQDDAVAEAFDGLGWALEGLIMADPAWWERIRKQAARRGPGGGG